MLQLLLIRVVVD